MLNPATDQTFVSEKYTPRFSPTDRLSARYLVRRYLSRDAIGEVYLCVDRELSKPVTIKLVYEALLADEAVRSKAIASAQAAMQAEALPYVLPIIDILETTQTPALPALVGFVSPHIEGTSLEDYLASYSQLAFDLGASLFRDVAAALLALHKAGRHHGALCPANIWLEHKAETLIPHLRGLTDADLQPLIPGLATERAPYLAPERQAGHPVDVRVDVYAFGVTLFEAFTGQRPTPTTLFILTSVLPNAPPDLDALILQSTNPERDGRFQSVLALKNILQDISVEAQAPPEERRPERPEIGDLIANQYQVESMLGEGGMARVYKARDTVLGTHIAVKLLNATCLAEPDVVARFIDEASIQAQLVHPEPHPNIVAVHRVLREVPVGFIMEFVPGTTLDNFIGSADVSLVDWIEMFSQICAGLHHAHVHRIIHRDLKPSNILVATDAHANRMAKLMDFGISKQLDQPKTRTNLILGTLGYLAPELFISARDASVQSDLYAIGCCMFEALTGQVPFPVEGGLRQLAFRVYNEKPPFPSDLGTQLPPPLEALIMMCLQKDPKKRPESSQWLCDRLLSILAERDDPALLEAIKVSGIQRKSFNAPTTLRHYVSAAQLEAAQKSNRLRASTTDRMGLSGSLSGAIAPLDRPSRRPLLIVTALLLLCGVGVVAWLLLSSPPPSQPVAAPTAPTASTTPGELTLKPSVILSAGDLLKQAEDAAARGDLDTAQTLTEQAIAAAEQAPADELDPTDLSSLYARAADIDSKRGDLSRASETLAKATALSSDPSLLLKKANIDSRRGDLDGAMAGLRKLNKSANSSLDAAARKKFDDDAAALKAQLLIQTEQLLDDAAAQAPQDPAAAQANLQKAQQLYDELADSADAKREAFFTKLSAAAEAANDLDTAAAAHQQAQDAAQDPSQDPQKTFDFHWRAADLAFKRGLFADVLAALGLAKPLAETLEQKKQVRELQFLAHKNLADASTGSARLSHTLAAIPLAPSPADADPLRAYAFGHYIATAEAATAANDPPATLAALLLAKPFAPDLASAKDLDKQIKRLESALKGRSKDDSDPSDPIPTDQIQIWIDSTPEGASVTLNNRSIGKTPLIRRLPKSPDAPKILLKADGHYDEPLLIDPAIGGHYQIKLKYKPPKIQ